MSKKFGNGTVFAVIIAEVAFVFHSGFWARTGRAGMRTRSLFLYAKNGVFVRRKLQNFAKLCKKMQKFARKFAYIKKMYYLCNVFRKRTGTNPKK